MPKTDVFISYARHDGTPLAKKLAQDLRSAGLVVFWDQDSIPAGANWEQTLDDALDEAAHILVILTPASVVSEEVTAEWRPMLSRGKNIIPLLYLPCEIPRRLTMRQYIDFQDESRFQLSLTELISAIQTFEPRDIAFDMSGEELIKRGQSYWQAGQPELSVRDYVAALRDPDEIVRLSAARWLGAAKYLGSVDAILDHLKTEMHMPTIVELFQAIRRIMETQDWRGAGIDLFASMQPYLAAPESTIRAEAIRVLAYAKALEAVPAVVELLLNDLDVAVRKQAALSLGRLKSPEASAGLEQALFDHSPEVRRVSAKALGVLGDPAVIEALRMIARKDRESEVRAAANEAIAELQKKK